MTLYVVHTIPARKSREALWEILNHGDALLLIEEGTYNLKQTDFLEESSKLEEVELYFLATDARARGVAPDETCQFSPIDYKGWVTLTEKHTTSVNW